MFLHPLVLQHVLLDTAKTSIHFAVFVVWRKRQTAIPGIMILATEFMD